MRRVFALDGALLAHESRDGASEGRGLLAFELAASIEAVQFHPEADPQALVKWLTHPAWAATLEATYGRLAYAKMLRAASDPRRVPRTCAEMLPGWLTRQFNRLAAARGHEPLPGSPGGSAFAMPLASGVACRST